MRPRLMAKPVLLFVFALLATTLLSPGLAGAAQAQQISKEKAIEIAKRRSQAVAATEQHPDLAPSASRNKSTGLWEVGFFTGAEEVVQVVVDPVSGEVVESWTGYQVAWRMARGYPGAFGRMVNAPYIWLPLCAIFVLGLLDWRRPFRLAHLDLLVIVAGFGLSQYFFNQGNIGLSVPTRLPAAALPARARALARVPATRGFGPAPVDPGRRSRGRDRRADRRADHAERRRLERDRRRLLGCDRRRSDRRRRADLRQLPLGRPVRRHLRAGRLLRVRALRAGASLERDLGRPARRPRRRDLLRSGDDGRASSCWAAGCGAGAGGPSSGSCSASPGPPARTRPSRWSRTPTTRWSPRRWPATLLCLTPPFRAGSAGASRR